MRFTSYLTAGAFAALANAQTWTECNPTEKDCPNDPAMGAEFNTDFKAGKDAVKGWKQTAGSLNYGAGGAEFTINKRGESPTIQSEGFLHFGYVEVKCKAAAGTGIVSSIVLQSQDLDEVDWEFLGGVTDKVQMNYFGKGNTTSFDRMIEAPVGNVQQETHSYALNWTAEALTWIIDGKEVRTLKYEEANGGNNFPQTPVNVRIGIWAGGDPDNNEGTIQWAGGETDFSKAPFTMTVESVKVINNNPATEYKWTDKTGSWQSIEHIGGKEGAPQNSAVIEPSAGATGGGLASGINAPTATGAAPAEDTGKPAGDSDKPAGGSDKPAEGSGKPAQETPCTTSTPKPSGGSYNGVPPANPETPCDCGVATVTVIGTPPPASTPVEAPPASGPATSGKPEQPPTTPIVPPQEQPPYPTGGLITDTAPAPSIPFPTAPTGAIPGNGTNPPPPQFTGAASQHKVGAMFGAVAGAVLLAL